MMSNALWLLGAAGEGAGQVTTAPAGEARATSLLMSLLAVGFCVAVVWAARRVVCPEKLLLRNTPRRPNNLHLGHVLVVFLGSILVQALATVVLTIWYPMDDAAAAPWRPWLDYRPIVLVTLCGHVAMLGGSLTAAALMFRWGLRRGAGLSGRHWLCDTARGVLGLLAIWPVCYAMLLLGRLFVPEPEVHVMLRALVAASLPWRVAIAVSTIVLVPLAEELFFRGLVQSMFRRWLGRPWLAMLLTAAIFALIHVPMWEAQGALLVLGLGLGYNYERTGRLLPAIVMHAAFNGVNVWLYLLGAS